MGRRKQSHPYRSRGLIADSNGTTKRSDKGETELTAQEENVVEKPFFVTVCRDSWASDHPLDISEVVLTNLNSSKEVYGCITSDQFYQDSRYSLRFRVSNAEKFVDRIKLGHWPVLSSSDVTLEFVEKKSMTDDDDDTEAAGHSVIYSGSFDGPDEGVTGLVHLASLEFMTLRPVPEFTFSEGVSSIRVRVEIVKNAFTACESLHDNTRPLWKRSMMNVMAWLRPEVTTSEARYEGHTSTENEVELLAETEYGISDSRKHLRFDVSGFYEAIKPSKTSPKLEASMPELLPVLRPYQQRAAYWMVQREKGDLKSSKQAKGGHFLSPLCIPVHFLDSSSKMFYNPFSGSISMDPECSSSYVRGGILADEMGLGKTVELLACILAHQKLEPEGGVTSNNVSQTTTLKRLKRERIECICGAVSESRKYKGLWVQCDICDAWQHADCVGYSPRGKAQKVKQFSNEQGDKKRRKKDTINIVIREEEHICQICSELLHATDSPIPTGATLIVCPAPILSQWLAEIERHTRPGSFKTCVYEGVRNTSLSKSATVDIDELLRADIVLTTYDALKDDLSHDSDRHIGDRHFLRFQKRYPVIPTLLTRIHWWRICLDEAQMVESNAAAATEMAMRLFAVNRWCITGTPIQRKLDDLYGLLRFLEAKPFNVSRWWMDVIRDPYERTDAIAMEFVHDFFKQIMWRSSKVHVADELLLPPQEECLSWLTFSPVEEHFYHRQHETCVCYAREVIESLRGDILKREVPDPVSYDSLFNPFITHAEASKLLNSLLKLRQACCHPQVGSSGLRSLQQAPMTMDEILMVLLNKTKIEGEEALRRVVVALNGLAGIAMIEQTFSKAEELYKESLSITKEHFEDFRLDPLLNIHILHNLVEILPLIIKTPEQTQNTQKKSETSVTASKIENDENYYQDSKRRRISRKAYSACIIPGEMIPDHLSEFSENGLNGGGECEDECQSLRIACEKLKHKYLVGFSSKHSAAQQEFKKSYMQVSDAFRDRKKQHAVWWLEVLHHAEQHKEISSDLFRKIEEAVSETLNNSTSSRTASRFQSIDALKYHLQTSLDLLETSRKTLLDQLLEIDRTMDKPKEEDIELVRYCQSCQGTDDGPTCLHCKLDELFQDYEARLFRLNKLRGGMMESAEEAVGLQKKNSALNRFFWSLSEQRKSSTTSYVGNEESKRRDIGEKVVVSKAPSETEVVLGVIRNHCKSQLGREGMLAATKQLQILEGMRKEYGQARSLAKAQSQLLRAYDEIKMSTTRLRLRENENDSSIDALSSDELALSSVENSSEKFMAMALLSRIKGKLRYLKGLVKSKQKPEEESSDSSLLTQETETITTSMKPKDECQPKADEACPICQEKLSGRRMVFQCGHVTCCKCLFAMTERTLLDDTQHKWVICPICRQHTDVGNIACADDNQEEQCNSVMMDTSKILGKPDSSINVEGSYGTKIEAITRRILWIKSTNPNAKVLVFSSWNDVLDVLEHAFKTNNVTYIRMKGGRKSQVAITKFREQKEPNDIQVLLLLVQHGANGLNLLEAQHVILVEPLLNPAAEAQAVSRVHRIGQQNTTIVHRFLVKDTVEDSIYKLNRSRNTKSFISGNTKNQDQPLLTLKDIESLFTTVSTTSPETDENQREPLRDLPPSMAAAIAAERRLNENRGRSCLP